MPSNTITSRLQNLADKQKEWQALEPTKKLHFLDHAIESLESEVKVTGLVQMIGEKAADMKKAHGPERDVIISEEVMIMAAYLKPCLENYRETFRVRAGTSKFAKELTNVPARKDFGQVIAQAFPLTEADKAKENPFSDHVGEVWFDPKYVQETSQAKPFQFDAIGSDNQNKKDGVLVVLGAGNYTVLSVADTIWSLFVRNRTVFVKQHPLRSFVDDLMRIIFAPLYQAGYLDSEVDHGIQRTEEIVFHPLVTSIHMTGGKPTHDAIVWGKTKEEQKENKPKGTPRLKNAEMTSELGCVTPYIITPAEYTHEELVHQAKTLITAKWINGGASCNAPQVVVMAKSWPQRFEFESLLEQAWRDTPVVPTYYPGAGERWKKFQQAYPSSSRIIHSHNAPEDTHNDIDESHLPLLMVNVEVDRGTEEGRQQANIEYALRNEAFAPVLAIATVEDDSTVEDFMTKTVELCNKSMFGTLSCSMAVPPSMENSDAVNTAVAGLKYGAIVFNAWSGLSYGFWSLAWGGVSGETLDDVESGIGKVCNCLAFTNIEKVVCRGPIIHPMHLDFCKSNSDIRDFNMFAANMSLPDHSGEEKKV